MFNNHDINIDPVHIGNRIRKEREKYTLSIEKFAEMIGLSSFYIGQLERGERRMSLETAIKISQAFNLSIDYIIKGETKSPSNSIAESYENYLGTNEEEIKELLNILSNATPNQIVLIKDLCKILIPHIKK